MSDNRRVFIVGTGRCGSTLVHDIVCRHESVGFVSNLEDRFPVPVRLTARTNALYRAVPVSFTAKGRARVAPSEAYRLLQREVSPVVVDAFRDLDESDANPWLVERVRRFFDRRAVVQGQPVFLHKFTGWPRVGLLRACYPHARIIHIVRDGRAVANSLAQMTWWTGHRGPDAWGWGRLSDDARQDWESGGQDFVHLAGLLWVELMERYDKARGDVGREWLEIRYEDVLADPDVYFDRMLSFCGLAPSSAFAAQLARYTFDPGRRDSWRRDLTGRQQALLDRSLGPTLERHGYRVSP